MTRSRPWFLFLGPGHEPPFPLTAAAAALLLLASPALGQQVCGTRDTVLDHLARQYQEAPVAGGVTSRGALVELLTTADGNTWTIIVSTPDGMSCFVAVGEGWRTKEPVEPVPEGMVL